MSNKKGKEATGNMFNGNMFNAGVDNSDDATDDLELIGDNIKQGKEMLERVAFFHHQLAKICDVLTEYGVKSNSLGDKSALLAENLTKLQRQSALSTRADLGLNVIPDLIASLGDHRDAEVKQIKTKVVPILSRYGLTCKYLKNSIKDALNALEAEKASIKRVRKLLYRFDDETDPGRRRMLEFQLEAAETEYEKNSTISTNFQKLASEQMLQFEQAHSIDLRKFLLAFFRTELGMHAKSIEILSEAYRFLGCIDDDDDSVIKTVLEAGAGSGPGVNKKVESKDRRHKSASSTAMSKSVSGILRKYSAGEIVSDSNFTQKSKSKASRKTELAPAAGAPPKRPVSSHSHKPVDSSSKEAWLSKTILTAAKPDKYRSSKGITSETSLASTSRWKAVRSRNGCERESLKSMSVASVSTFPCSIDKDFDNNLTNTNKSKYVSGSSGRPTPKTSKEPISKSKTMKSFPSSEMFDESGTWNDIDSDNGTSVAARKATKPSRKVSFEAISMGSRRQERRTGTSTSNSCLWTETEAAEAAVCGRQEEEATEASESESAVHPESKMVRSAKSKSTSKSSSKTKNKKEGFSTNVDERELERDQSKSRTRAGGPAPRVEFAKIENVSTTLTGLDTSFVRPATAISSVKEVQPTPASGLRNPQQQRSASALYRRMQFL